MIDYDKIIKSANDTMMQLHNEVMQLNKYLEASYVCYENMLNRYLKLQDRINKAIEYIEEHKLDRKPNTTTRLEAHTLQEWKLLEILKGEE